MGFGACEAGEVHYEKYRLFKCFYIDQYDIKMEY